MTTYKIVPLSNLLDTAGEDLINIMFKKFSCSNEKDLENFLLYKAIKYEKEFLGRTFLLITPEDQADHIPDIIAYYTLANTSIDLTDMGKNKKKRIMGDFPNKDALTNFPAFLIGQLGRNDRYSHADISGETLLNCCLAQLKNAAFVVGGKLIVLECRPHMYEKVYEKLGFNKMVDSLSKDGLYMLYKRVDFSLY